LPRRGYSRHIPDFRYVTFLAEGGTSFVHKANPWTKLALLAVVVSLVTVLMDTILLAILLVLTIALYTSARLPLGLLLGWWTLPLFFVISLSVLFIFTEPGSQVAGFDFGDTRIAVTDEGLLLTANLLVKALAVVTCSLAVFMTTRYNHVVLVVYKVMPKTLGSIFLLSYRFMFETSDEFSDIVDAMHSRSGSLARGVARQSRAYAGIFGLAFVHAFERAEKISKAMEARGFTGDLPVYDTLPRPTAGGYFVIGLGIVAVVLAAYSRYLDTSPIGW
jgi:cobalt/nickel transport system permease protein